MISPCTCRNAGIWALFIIKNSNGLWKESRDYEKMKSIRYKMTAYDEFLEEYQYRKKYYGGRDGSKMVAVSKKSRDVR